MDTKYPFLRCQPGTLGCIVHGRVLPATNSGNLIHILGTFL